MAEFVEALDAALEQRYALGPHSRAHEPKTPITSPKGLEIRMRRIMDKFKGDRRAAAAAVGVPYSTWGHLLHGRRASRKNFDKINAAWQKIFTAPARALRVKKVGLPHNWLIKAVVIADPGEPDEPGSKKGEGGAGGGGSRYANGHGSGLTRAEARALDTTDPAYRLFRAEGLDSGAIVDAWLTDGAEAAADALLDEIEVVYGTEFGFEGDDVEVSFEDE